MEQEQAEVIFQDTSMWDSKMRKRLNNAMENFRLSCLSKYSFKDITIIVSETLQNKEFMNWLKDSKFDLAFVHMYHACPLGLTYAAGIPTVWVSRSVISLISNIDTTNTT